MCRRDGKETDQPGAGLHDGAERSGCKLLDPARLRRPELEVALLVIHLDPLLLELADPCLLYTSDAADEHLV